jgi:hypothetical protein
MIILNPSDIINNLPIFSISIPDNNSIKIIVLISSICLIFLPVYLSSGAWKKGAKDLGKVIGHIATGGAAYI